MIDWSKLAFVDCETTGLSAEQHEIWEVGLIVDDAEFRWFLPVDLGRADHVALQIGGYYERHPYSPDVQDAWRNTGLTGPLGNTGPDPREDFMTVQGFAEEFSALTRGRHLVGAVVSFDEERLRKLLRANQQAPGWHYHICDVEALVAGKLGFAPPWDSNELSKAVGIDPETFDRHTALGDCRWALALFKAVIR